MGGDAGQRSGGLPHPVHCHTRGRPLRLSLALPIRFSFQEAIPPTVKVER